MLETYNPVDYRSKTVGYRNKSTIGEFVKYFDDFISGKGINREIAIIGSGCSCAHLGVALALQSRHEVHYYSDNALTEFYFEQKVDSFAHVPYIVFVDDHIALGRTFHKTKQLFGNYPVDLVMTITSSLSEPLMGVGLVHVIRPDTEG